MQEHDPIKRPLLDLSNPLEASIARARVECTCHVYDDGDGESGPHLSITYDENCPQHGRFADPEGWAEADAHERGYVLSSLHSLARGVHDTKLAVDDDVAFALIQRAERVIADERKTSDTEDDGHDIDRAVSRVLDALLLIEGTKTNA